MLSYEQAKARAEKQDKDFKVQFGFEYKGNYCFNLTPKNVPSGEIPYADFHIVDSETGEVSGYYSVMELLQDPEFEQKLQACLNKGTDVVEHHGIKGQQWGVRNGPPYPLDAETHKQVVKKNETVEKGVDPELAALGIQAVAALTIAATAAIANAVKTRKKHKELTENTRFESDLLREKNIANLDKYFSKDNPPRKINGPHSVEDDMAKVNPLYDRKIPQTHNNCLLSSITYDLRRRGYDVTALLTSKGMFGKRTEKDVYKNPKQESFSRCNTWQQVEQQMLKKYPDGSRGVLHIAFVSYFYGSAGHAMSWEIHNGKLNIIDAQRNVQGRISKKDMTTIFTPSLTTATRTDNLEVNWEKMNSICAEVLDKKDVKHSFDLTTRAVIGMAGIGDILVSELNDDYLEHHGIKGMKWGIRRFQNYDGSYTKKGLERYEYDEKRYHEAKRERDEARTAYKNGTGSKDAVQNANIKLKAAKRQLSAAYDQVKKDKRADEGKKLYESGKRITTNVIGENIKQIGVAFIGNLFAKKLDNQGKHLQATALCAAGNAFLAASYIRTKLKNRKIAAYYSHSRPDSLKMPKSEGKKS